MFAKHGSALLYVPSHGLRRGTVRADPLSRVWLVFFGVFHSMARGTIEPFKCRLPSGTIAQRTKSRHTRPATAGLRFGRAIGKQEVSTSNRSRDVKDNDRGLRFEKKAHERDQQQEHRQVAVGFKGHSRRLLSQPLGSAPGLELEHPTSHRRGCKFYRGGHPPLGSWLQQAFAKFAGRHAGPVAFISPAFCSCKALQKEADASIEITSRSEQGLVSDGGRQISE
mmetsp:Transcript_77728/g.161519  ORF Transcript_77728/g.161519 Transcript_77728/m.161519 type:complete len:224 (+) Transcript_77728:107-778(+)